jgi:hypothetical protein
MWKCLFLLGLSVLLQGCGYRFGHGELTCKYHTICIPYVIGDKTGELTATLVKEMAKSGAFRYLSSGADISLKVAIIDLYEDNIGYRYDRDKDGERENYIIPTETRIALVAEVTVVENCSGCIALGPARIVAGVDFDHDYYFGSDHVNNLSLGQLTDIDAAYDSVQTPLYQALAEKIVDYVINSY